MSRRSRARKARIVGRVLAFAMMIGLAALIRTDPQVRAAVDGIVTELVAKAMGTPADPARQGDPARAAIDDLGYAPGSDEAQALEQLGLTETGGAPARSSLPPSKVKVNRGTGG
ncbi:hypothetical protein KDD17_10535 [Sulfitobacter albidus]|uniref:Uncharacterized protein n=1 Tax=Sulfitobacter albidus TaxID=2829501 RepID=A0A975JBW2_9RHOB|nr:hypothetical protein [Sulfitobacter albidus]QUJ75416.1 hypothetical protein KDD17_10535 [Sulfitobacter albidus]